MAASAALLSASAAAAPVAPAPRPVLRVAWIDPTGCAGQLQEFARDEVAGLLGRMGVALRWRRADPGVVSSGGEVHLVILDRPLRRGSAHQLGLSHLGQGVAVAWVHLPGVLSVLGIDPRSGTHGLGALERRRAGIAVGRVCAHEIVHALAPSVAHGTGLMSARLGDYALTSGRPAIEDAVALAVRKSMAVEPEALSVVATR